MKYFLIILTLLVSCINAWAHPSSDITVDYNDSGNVLNLDIIHKVSNSNKHFIDKVKIYINGELVAEQFFRSQSNLKMQNAIYILPDVRKGDIIVIETKCNIFGVKKSTFTVKK